MRLADQFLAFRAPNGAASCCRVRVFLPEDDGGAASYVVVATDDADAAGMSITNAAETLAAQVCLRWNIPPERLTWVEHYDYRHRPGGRSASGKRTESFDRVLFLGGARPVPAAGQVAPPLGEPDWQPTDKASVEALLGEALP